MKVEQILPTLLIIIDVLSAIVYGCKHDARMTVYWLAAAALTLVVTY